MPFINALHIYFSTVFFFLVILAIFSNGQSKRGLTFNHPHASSSHLQSFFLSLQAQYRKAAHVRDISDIREQSVVSPTPRVKEIITDFRSWCIRFGKCTLKKNLSLKKNKTNKRFQPNPITCACSFNAAPSPCIRVKTPASAKR